MKKSNNIISDWLDQYGDPEIEKQVEKDAERINNVVNLKTKIKQYCKTHKLKFEKYIQGGFIGSCLIPIRAGVEKDIHTGKYISLPIIEIGKKRVYRKFICYSDGDIVDDGLYDY